MAGAAVGTRHRYSLDRRRLRFPGDDMKTKPMDAGTPASVTDHAGQEIPTYYGRPAIRPSLYGWIVAAYIYVGGLAAGLQIVVTAGRPLAPSWRPGPSF